MRARPKSFHRSLTSAPTTRLARQRHARSGMRRWLLGVSLGITGAMSILPLTAGCTRAQHRAKTNREAYHLIDEKIADSGENTRPYRIELDPRSRMFDPFNPDRPPMPEDDPASNRYMCMVDKKHGYPLWEANGRTNLTENPQWWNYLPLDERGVLVLDLDTAVRIGLLHSPQYQQAMETLYLSALDVSSERFLLDSQFFGGYSTTYTTDGRRRNNGNNSSTTVSTGPFSRGRRPFSMERSFATGADLVVGFANNLTWQISGPNNQSATTLLDFSLIQPLLRQAGRDVVLERLTLAERTLLSNVRAFERYRRSFYLRVATGRTLDQAPQRRGGVFGGAGLSGFTGLGGGFGQVTGGGGGGNQGFANTAAPSAAGYLGLLQDQLSIENTDDNLISLKENLLQLEDTYRELLQTIPLTQTAIPQQRLQVAQTRQSLFGAQVSQINLQSTYESSLDQFKRDLGLPPYLCIEIRDNILDSFKLVTPELRQRRYGLAALREEVGKANTAILELSTVEKDAQTGSDYRSITNSDTLLSSLRNLALKVQPIKEVYQRLIDEDLTQIKADIERLRSIIPHRANQLARLRDIAVREKDLICRLLPLSSFDLSLLDDKKLAALPEELEKELARLTARFQQSSKDSATLEQEIAKIINELAQANTGRTLFANISTRAMLASQSLISRATEEVLALQLVQARARTETAVLAEIDIEPRDALEIARVNRHDWMNTRAAVVNSWRAIEVVADDLESTLDLTFSGDVQNVGDNPLALRSSTGRLRVGLQWDAPITRLQERNRYRQVLIEFQQARRSYYLFEDAVWNTLRTQLRSIRLSQFVFEQQRFALSNAAEQISINEDIRQINETLGQASGPTASRDAVGALTDLLTSQNTFIGTWALYESLRRNLDHDMGTLQIDGEGLWIDPGPIRADTMAGRLGQAIVDYGLTEGDQAIRQQMESESEDFPVELAPSNSQPQSTIPNEKTLPIAANKTAVQVGNPHGPSATANQVYQPVSFQAPMVPSTPFSTTIPITGGGSLVR